MSLSTHVHLLPHVYIRESGQHLINCQCHRHVENTMFTPLQGSWGQHGAHLGPTAAKAAKAVTNQYRWMNTINIRLHGIVLNLGDCESMIMSSLNYKTNATWCVRPLNKNGSIAKKSVLQISWWNAWNLIIKTVNDEKPSVTDFCWFILVDDIFHKEYSLLLSFYKWQQLSF